MLRALLSVAVLGLVSACMAADPRIVDVLARVDRDRIMGDVEALCAIGPRPGSDKVATEKTLVYLEQELRAVGLQPERREFFAWSRKFETLPDGTQAMTMAEGTHDNLVVVLPGAADSSVVVEAGAHYDTVPQSPGADDNASGTAALLEVARVLAQQQTRKTIRLVFFALEEDGKVGSREYVKQLVAAEDVPEGILSLDAVGFTNKAPDSQESPVRVPLVFWPPSVGDFVLVLGNWSSTWLGELLEDCIDVYVPELDYYGVKRIGGWFKDSTRGDHYEYWQQGIPAIAVTDVPYMRGGPYHKREDQPATLDPTFLHQNTQAIAATLLEWAELR